MLLLLTGIVCNNGFAQQSETIVKDKDKEEQFLEFLDYFEEIGLPYEQSLEMLEINHPLPDPSQLKIFPKPTPFEKIAEPFIPWGKPIRCSTRPKIKPVGRFLIGTNTVAIIYEGTPLMGSRRTVNYYLTYFDLKGNLLPFFNKKTTYLSEFIIGYSRLFNTQSFSINSLGRIEIFNSSNQWSLEFSYENVKKNELIGYIKNEIFYWQLDGLNGIKIIK